jgi:hypothetical protein
MRSTVFVEQRARLSPSTGTKNDGSDGGGAHDGSVTEWLCCGHPRDCMVCCNCPVSVTSRQHATVAPAHAGGRMYPRGCPFEKSEVYVRYLPSPQSSCTSLMRALRPRKVLPLSRSRRRDSTTSLAAGRDMSVNGYSSLSLPSLCPRRFGAFTGAALSGAGRQFPAHRSTWSCAACVLGSVRCIALVPRGRSLDVRARSRHDPGSAGWPITDRSVWRACRQLPPGWSCRAR